MDDYLIVRTADSRSFDLPVVVRSDGRTFEAGQPAIAEEIDIAEIRLVSQKIGRAVRFILESFTLAEGEAGRWTVTLSENEFGDPKYDLEYHATGLFGKPVCNAAVMHWDHEKEEMTAD